jgi:hypothetical protein
MLEAQRRDLQGAPQSCLVSELTTFKLHPWQIPEKGWVRGLGLLETDISKTLVWVVKNPGLEATPSSILATLLHCLTGRAPDRCRWLFLAPGAAAAGPS